MALELVAIVGFSKKFEKEFSLMPCFGGIGCLGCNGSLAWFLDSGASRHMTGMRNVFLIYSDLGSGELCGVRCEH